MQILQKPNPSYTISKKQCQQSWYQYGNTILAIKGDVADDEIIWYNPNPKNELT